MFRWRTLLGISRPGRDHSQPVKNEEATADKQSLETSTILPNKRIYQYAKVDTVKDIGHGTHLQQQRNMHVMASNWLEYLSITQEQT